jgi:hypothetical protein
MKMLLWMMHPLLKVVGGDQLEVDPTTMSTTLGTNLMKQTKNKKKN